MRNNLTNHKTNFPCITEGCAIETEYDLMSVAIKTSLLAPSCERCKMDLDNIEQRISKYWYPIGTKKMEIEIKVKDVGDSFYWFKGNGYSETTFDGLDAEIVGWGRFYGN